MLPGSFNQSFPMLVKFKSGNEDVRGHRCFRWRLCRSFGFLLGAISGMRSAGERALPIFGRPRLGLSRVTGVGVFEVAFSVTGS
jgi:hypothetical protein